MGCRFCASTLNGKKRNLSAGEMLGQVVSVNRLHGSKTVQNVVMMGSGEPLDNYNNVLKFIRLISLSEGLNISQRRITLSTCGLADKIRSLADERLAITLSVSLHASNDDIRQSLMPIARRYSIKELISACKHYISLTHRRVSFEYALIKGVNDGQEHAEELCQILRGFQCHVNLITLNAVDETDYVGSDRFAANKFFNYLNEKNIAVSMRRTMGEDIQGACGQLRNEFIKGEG
jgi:23S rRNA (adenine2503-C2)-methyltransferase